MKLCVLGHFGHGQNLMDGQTVKTKNLYDGIKKYSDIELYEVDTYNWAKRPLSLIKNIKNACRECDAVVMLPAHRGVQVISHILLRYGRRYNTRLYYDVIGGWLPELLKYKDRLSRAIRSFDGIWVETSTMKKQLDAQGFENVTVVPNFKELTPLSAEELIYPTGAPYKLCTFSRVMKKKGIESAADAVVKINTEFGYTVYELDIYGPVDPAETEWFDELKSRFPSYVNYKGSVPSDKSVEVLKDAFALLFPTHFYTEGIPGTIIDAYAAGVPVVSASWESCADVVDDGVSGFVYAFDDQSAFEDVLTRIAREPHMLTDLKENCTFKAKEYMTDCSVGKIVGYLKGENA